MATEAIWEFRLMLSFGLSVSRWVFTVLTLMPRAFAVALTVPCSVIAQITSCSRGVRCGPGQVRGL
jgi:hypothetical protein